MKATITKISCILLFSVIALNVSAQYETAIGVRFGEPGKGLTILRYLDPQSRGAVNFLVTSQYKGFCITGLYEVHSKNHNINIEIANVGGYLGLSLIHI